MKININTTPVIFDNLNLFKAIVKYRAKATKINDIIVYSMEPDWIRIGLVVVAPSIIVLRNQGTPRENNIAIVLAPNELETPKEPSPLLAIMVMETVSGRQPPAASKVIPRIASGKSNRFARNEN